MEFNEVINQRKTSREWTDKEVDFEAIKRILEAGMKALPGITTEAGSLLFCMSAKIRSAPLPMQRPLPNAMWTVTAHIRAPIWRRKCMPMPCRGSIPCWWTVPM